MPINTSRMLHHDPVTYVVRFQRPPRPPAPARTPLHRVLAALALAGLATRALELLAGR